MNKDRFLHHCSEAEAGRGSFVAHPDSSEDGIVLGCNIELGHFIVRTPDNQKRCWDYQTCEDLEINRASAMM